MTFRKKFFSVIGLVMLLSACTPYFQQPLRIKQSRLGAETPRYRDLTSLPLPKELIPVAVYKFRDQTGQYKATEVGASWSTAVTQGATSILLRALEESKWFLPIERESLSNLLNERKIIRSSRATYNSDKDNDQLLLPPLLFAGILLEGGIISFDSNVLTGGAGARYFGAGASTQYREDRVTVYLRAVSTSNGKILKIVYTSKTILSQKIDVGFFRFVKVKRLLEAETGFTYNEPAEMAVKEAIEKAVISLIIEGMQDNLWTVGNEEDLNHPIVKQYLEEKNANVDIDVFGNTRRERRGSLAINASGGGLFYNGDVSGTRLFPGMELGLDFRAGQGLSVSTGIGYGQLGTHLGYRSSFAYADLALKYRFFNLNRYSPYVKAGAGLLTEEQNNINSRVSIASKYFGYGFGEVGFEYLIQDRLGIHGAATFRGVFSDGLDQIEQGKFNDIIWQMKVGLSFYAF
jgi:curli production assembly/transport component CsgG